MSESPYCGSQKSMSESPSLMALFHSGYCGQHLEDSSVLICMQRDLGMSWRSQHNWFLSKISLASSSPILKGQHWAWLPLAYFLETSMAPIPREEWYLWLTRTEPYSKRKMGASFLRDFCSVLWGYGAELPSHSSLENDGAELPPVSQEFLRTRLVHFWEASLPHSASCCQMSRPRFSLNSLPLGVIPECRIKKK